jgi:diguanylate cyclase (GGDEF)-like protein
MGGLPESVQKKLSALADGFLSRLPERMGIISDLVDRLSRENENGEIVADLHMNLHKLSGSAATFGYGGISDLAKQMEKIVADISEGRVAFDASMKRHLIDSHQGLRLGVERIQDDSQKDTPGEQVKPLVDQEEYEYSAKHLLFVCEPDTTLNEDLEEQLGFYGFSIESVCSFSALQNLVQENPKQILLVDSNLLKSNEENPHRFGELKRIYSPYLFIIYLSEYNDFETRLKAVRAGGDAFFFYPVDVGRLIDKIDVMMNKDDFDPYHILIVDDDPDQVSFNALLLQQAGMITSVARDPKQVIKVLVESKPELILMDMYMPGCSGVELASVIRQQEAFVSIPIVFLSVETDTEKQIDALRMGADDFLTKPIKGEHLIASIKNRAERTRSLRYLMERDSLTGLLNHSNVKEQLSRELMRSNRAGSQVCFAMIDVDHFKKVNDTYGHLTGDRVLKGLARLLQERVRSTDIIGRYGGEEFAVILINTSLSNAKKIMDEIRENFSQIKQQSDKEEFFVTFSCGIAGFPDFADPARLNDAADKALYQAKETGRNRVLIARPAKQS